MTVLTNSLERHSAVSSWKTRCLFLTVFLFPLQTILLYNKNLHNFLSFYGQIAAVPLLVGIGLSLISCIQRKEIKNLLPFLAFSLIYLFVIAIVSIHSISNFSATGFFDAATFGETAKISLLKSLFSRIGFSNDATRYVFLIFTRDFLTGCKELIYAFGFSFWVALLYRQAPGEVFKTIKDAILCDIVVLAPYVTLEVFHLYGMVGATTLLRKINSLLYETGGRVGWYPPMVSPNQVRGTWTEPSFFSVWLAFITPFLVCHFFQTFNKRKVFIGFFFFLLYWNVWQMTYSRTSIILMIALFCLYLFIALISRKKCDWIRLAILMSTFTLSFVFVSTLGPEEMASKKKYSQEESVVASISSSEFVTNTVESSFNPKSRSTPTRIENINREVSIFKLNPVLGVGDTLCSVPQVKWMEQNYSNLTDENRVKLKFMQEHGIFESYAGNCHLLFTEVLMCRGILGFFMMYAPIVCLGILFFIKIVIDRKDLKETETAVFISCVSVFLTAITPGLWLLYFWCAAGLALGMILNSNYVNRISEVSLNVRRCAKVGNLTTR